jgi:putative ABC transport system permease protein
VARDWLSGPDVAELQRAGGVIDAAAGTQLVGPTFSATASSEPLQVSVMLTSPNLFDLLGVAPALGRTFTADEVGPNRPSVIVLSHALWNKLGADPAIVGHTVFLSGTPYAVIGVMGADFHFVRHATVGPPSSADAYMPFRFHVADQDPNANSFAALVRVKPGTTPGQALAAVEASGRRVQARYAQNRPFRLFAVGLQPDLVARVRPVLLALAAAGAFLLAVLTANLASLLLARAASREREFAVARAVGAGGGVIVRTALFEGVLLGLTGGTAAAGIGFWGTRLLVTLAPLDLPRRDTIALDGGIALIVIGAGMVIGVLAAVVPAAWASRVPLGPLVAGSAVRGAASVTPIRRVMIVAQIAISLVLLCAGGLVVRSFQQLLASDPGFRPNGVVTFTVAMGPRLFPKPEAAMQFQDRLEAALRRMPGVSDVSATTALPLLSGAGTATVAIPGAPGNTGDPAHDAPVVDLISARSRYPEVMGMTLLAGRTFSVDRRAGVKEAIVDEHLARTFFPSGTPLGATVTMNHQALTVVGVVRQARLYDLHEDGRPQLYVRGEDWTPYTPGFVIRTAGDPRALIASIAGVVRAVDPRIPVASIRPMDEIVNDALRQPRISAVLIGGFAVGALLLVSLGLFGMVSGSVTQRRGELAVRLALGATHGRVLRLVMGEGTLLVALGMAIALPGIYVSGRLLRALLVGVSPLDPGTLGGVAAGLAVVTLAACFLPARRVLAIECAPLLRQE